jgi:LPS O-antigen subunit length determinant protein (WzzB/FepE family)
MQDQEPFEATFSITQLFQVLLKRKWLVISGTVVITVLAVALAMFLSPVYRSNAVISISGVDKTNIPNPEDRSSLPGLSIPEVTSFLDVIKSRSKFKRFLNLNGHKVDWPVSDLVLLDSIRPVFAYENGSKVKVTENFAVNIRISSQATTAGEAHEKTDMICQFVITHLLNSKIDALFGGLSISLNQAIARFKKRIGRLEWDMKQLKEKEIFIEDEILKIPGVAKLSDLEIINANKKNEKYLPPYQQLVAVKIDIKDIELRIKQFERNLNEKKAFLFYTNSISSLFDKDKNYMLRKNLLEDLIASSGTFFKGHTGEEFEDSRLIIEGELLRYKRYRDVIFQVISGPNMPVKPVTPPKKLIAVTAFVLSFCFFFLLTLALEWWGKNKKQILS